MGRYGASPVRSGGSGEPEPALAPDLRTLFDTCPGCGWPTSQETCPSCGGSSRWDTGDGTGVAPPLGQLVRSRRSWPARSGVVVELGAEKLTVVRPDGVTARLPVLRYRTVRIPPGLALVRSAAGALLAAAVGLDLTARAAQQLHQRAWAMAGAAPGGWRAFAADCAALGAGGTFAGFPLPDSERTWWSAQTLWTAGQRADAAAVLLQLPAARYPGRLALWWRLATDGSLPASLRPAVAAAARELVHASPAAAVAASLLLRELGERTGAAGDAGLVGAVHALGGEAVAARLAGQPADSTAARLLGALAGQVAPPELAADPALPEAAPLTVLDDLVDRGQVPPVWLTSSTDAAGPARYLRARSAIGTLDDAALAQLGAHDERARRSLREGGTLPADLPPDVAQRFAPVPAARNGDQDALLALADAAGLGSGQLRAALADPESLPAGQLLADGSVAERLLERSTADPAEWLAAQLDPHQRRFAARLALRRAKRQLYAWDWPAALAAARICLGLTGDETLRDEAHNLIGAAQWQLGNDDAASKALGAALDGEYTAALQVNYAVVASELEPERAAGHLTRLMQEAPNLPLRVSAGLQAVRLWRSGEQWQHGDPLPADLAGALRSLVVEPVEYDAFRGLVQLLARHDSEWLAAPGALDGSTHRSTQAARIWTANARGGEEFIGELAVVLRATPERWVEELRDLLLDDLLRQLRSTEPNRPWKLGALLLEQRVPMPVPAWVELVARTVSEVCADVDTRTAEPAGKCLDWLEQAIAEVKRQPDDQREQLAPWLHAPLSRLTMVYVSARRHQLEQVEALHASVLAQMAKVPSGMTVNLESVRSAVQPGVDLCRGTGALLDRLVRAASSLGLNQPGTSLLTAIEELRRECGALRERLDRLARGSFDPPPGLSTGYGQPAGWPGTGGPRPGGQGMPLT